MSTVSGSASNASPPASRPPQQHTRTYQACIPCRRRKVRCDLGPVDNPHDPPCVRCRRESKECFFSATRRKRKGQDGEDLDEPLDDYEVRNGRKRSRTAPETIHIPRPPSGNYVSQPLTPGGSVGRYEPLRRPTNHSNTSEDPRHEEDDQNVSNATAGILQTKEVFSGHDALNLLFEAAGRNGDIAHHRSSSASNHARPSMGVAPQPTSSTRFASPQMTSPNGFDNRNHAPSAPEPSFGPAREQSEVPILPEPRNDPSLPQAIQAWRKFRLVRAGWLTAKEAIAYVDYFYTYLSPLTPIVVPDYRDYALHGKLLKEEPMLVVTILTITSRFVIPNTGGARTRSYHMHSKYWDYLKGMIDRMIFGQEQFGGGFCGAGQQPGSDTNPLSRKGLRTLGTVESLMLLTEWHPRALHFPPGDDDDELVLPDDLGEVDARAEHKASGGQRIDSWLEPCWRSDRMCWMLLGNATALAFEIGVFDDTSEAEFEEENRHLSHATVKAYFRRKNHLKDLLKIYITQTSGRLGLTTMLPKLERTYDIPTKTPNELYEDRVAQIKPPPPNLGMRPSGPDGNRLPFESVATQHRHAVQDLVLDFWSRIALIMDMGNQKLFPNRRQTRDLLKSGKYEELLRYFQTPLLDWSRSFALADKVPKQLRYVLTIEYEYTRVYLNSLALQAVVERCTHNTPQQQHTSLNGTLRDRDGGAIPFSTLVKWYGNDRHYISEVIDASRNVLKAVVEGLYPGDYLRHAPVRTFFRIVSVAIILLKTFALGATEDDVAYSLGLLDRAVSALRTSIVDDVHVGNRFAELVETLTRRIRSRFVRLSANASTGISRAGSGSPTRNGTLTPTMGPPRQPIQSQNNPGHLQPPYSGPGAGYTSATTSVPGSPSLNLTSGRQTPNPSLWGISAEPYDPNSGQHSLMPPPGFNPNNSNYEYMQQNQNYNNVNGYDSSGGFNQGDQDWLTLPLDPLLNQWGADITQTAMGPDVGGMDMLDILLNMGGGPPGSA